MCSLKLYGRSLFPQDYMFLWLFANNKVLTRDNLAKRRRIDDMSCLFCNEPKTVCHLFFNCCVAQAIWYDIHDMTSFPLITYFESVGKMWLRGKKLRTYNVLTAAVI
jgi:hypothetical protein